MNGFYNDKGDTMLMNEFFKQVDLCWMYCPDSVLNKAFHFLNMMKTGGWTKEEEENAMGELILEIRKDLIQNKEPGSTQL